MRPNAVKPDQHTYRTFRRKRRASQPPYRCIRAASSQLEHAFICLQLPSKQMLTAHKRIIKLPNLAQKEDCTIPARIPGRRMNGKIIQQPTSSVDNPNSSEAAERTAASCSISKAFHTPSLVLPQHPVWVSPCHSRQRQQAPSQPAAWLHRDTCLMQHKVNIRQQMHMAADAMSHLHILNPLCSSRARRFRLLVLQLRLLSLSGLLARA